MILTYTYYVLLVKEYTEATKIQNCGGELDVDANVRPETKKPVENIVWPDFKAPPGAYKVYVHHYKKHNKRTFKGPN